MADNRRELIKTAAWLRRLLLDFVLLLSIFLLPWWVSVVALLFLIFYFNFYWECLVLARLLDNIYWDRLVFWEGYQFTFLLLVGLLAAAVLKKRMIFYNK